jgi:hypothetical protein
MLILLIRWNHAVTATRRLMHAREGEVVFYFVGIYDTVVYIYKGENKMQKKMRNTGIGMGEDSENFRFDFLN